MGWVGSSFCLAGIEAARASLALAAGRPAEAFQHAFRIFGPVDAAGHWGISRWSTVLRDLADAARASNNTRTAVALLAPLDRTTGSQESRGTLIQAQVEPDQSEQLRQTRVWRLDQFTGLGFDSARAALMADDAQVDLAQARRLIALGCPLETVARILL
jgi:hypothetical protein